MSPSRPDATPIATGDNRLLWQPDPLHYRMQLRAEFGVSLAARKVVESDPADWPMPHAKTLRQLIRNHLRRYRQIIGYEYRKAAGIQRRYADPKSMAIIKGVTS